MNTETPTPPPLPNVPPTELLPPVRGAADALEALLRQPLRLLASLAKMPRLLSLLLGITVACSLAYGFVAGTFSGGVQLWAAPLKVAGGLLFAGAICLPSLYVFACLAGAKATLREVAGALAVLLALTTVLLFSFAPVVWVFSQSTASVAAMGALHLLFALVAFGFGARSVFTAFRLWSARALGGMVAWTLLFALVVLQMTTALRPIIGRADTLLPTEKRFFLAHWGECLSGRYDPPTPGR